MRVPSSKYSSLKKSRLIFNGAEIAVKKFATLLRYLYHVFSIFDCGISHKLQRVIGSWALTILDQIRQEPLALVGIGGGVFSGKPYVMVSEV